MLCCSVRERTVVCRSKYWWINARSLYKRGKDERIIVLSLGYPVRVISLAGKATELDEWHHARQYRLCHQG